MNSRRSIFLLDTISHHYIRETLWTVLAESFEGQMYAAIETDEIQQTNFSVQSPLKSIDIGTKLGRYEIHVDGLRRGKVKELICSV